MNMSVECRECHKIIGKADVNGFLNAICIPCYEALD